MEFESLRQTDFHNVVEYPRDYNSRKGFTGRIDTEEFFPIDIVELILIKEGFIDRFEDFSAIDSDDDLFDEKLAEYQMRLKFLDLFNELLSQVLDEFEDMIVVRSGGAIVSNEKGRRDDDDIMVKRIIGYDDKNKINLAYRRGYESDFITFSHIRMRSDFAKDLDYKDFIKEQINLYYVKQEFINS
jgi:hypothetical protein